MKMNREGFFRTAAAFSLLLATAATCEPNDTLHIVNDTSVMVRVQMLGASALFSVAKLAPHGETTTYLSRTNHGCATESFQAVDVSSGKVLARLTKPCPGDVWHIRTR